MDGKTKTLVGRVDFKNNIGHLGKEISFLGTHLHYEIAKKPGRTKEYWDNLIGKIRKFEVRFFAGDFNMSFADVTNQLRSRGLEVDLIAWYPFQLRSSATHTPQGLGIDSCGIFYVGGGASMKMQYSLGDIELLSNPQFDGPKMLTKYSDNCKPGQHWSCYLPPKNDLRCTK